MASPDKNHWREKRKAGWESTFSPGWLALTGALISLVLLFTPGIQGRLVILIFAGLAAWASGKRISFLRTALVMLGIIAANLLVPLGRRLFSWGPILITETALLSGIEKAISFEALILISKASIRANIKIPGRLGSFFSEALGTYNRILEEKAKIRPAHFMEDVDSILNTVYYSDEEKSLEPEEESVEKTRNALLLFALLPVILAWVV